MEFDETILRKITNFGAMQYSPKKICYLIGLTAQESEQLLQQMNTPDTKPFVAYNRGFAAGEYNIDAALMKLAETGDIMAESTLRERQQLRKIAELKQELFGI